MSIQYTSEQLQRKFKGAPGSAGFARIAEVLREEGRVEEAVALCRQGLEQKPGHITGILVLGKCLVDLERLEEAREQFESVLRQDSRCLAALHWLARIMTRLQWPDAAAAYYRSILEIEPWDVEALARYREAGAASAAGSPGAGGSPATDAAFPGSAFAPPRAEDGPFGASAVEEFPLDRVGDFLPGESGPADLTGALQEVSLAGPLDAPAPASPAPAPGSAEPEPLPLDVLTSASASPSPEPEAPAPISGDDVEARLDSLFGASDDAPLVPHDPSEAGALDEATLQLAARRTQERPAPAPDDAEEAAVSAPAPAPVEQDPSPMEVPVLDGADPALTGEPVSGDDIEQRLDDLFSLSEGTRSRPVTADIAPEPGPAAPVPESPLAPFAASAPAEELPDLVLAPEAGAAPIPAAGDEVVTGQDVADKLESLFGEGPATRDLPPPGGELPDSGSASWVLAHPAEDGPVAEATPAPGPESPAPFDLDRVEDGIQDPVEPPTLPEPGILTTESMLPRSPDPDKAPAITGEDIEARLDSLFSLEEAPRTADGIPVPGPEAVLPDSPLPETLPETPSAEPFAPEGAVAGPGEAGTDRTVLMPAMRETPGDWLARQGADVEEVAAAGEAPQAAEEPPAFMGDLGAELGRETLIVPAPDAGEDALPDPGPFAETARDTAPNPLQGAGDTVGMDMVEGSDIADRLDEIFAGQDRAPSAPATPEPELPAAGIREDQAREAAAAAAASVAAEAARWSPMPDPEVPGIPPEEVAPEEVVLFAEDPASALPPLEPELSDPALADPVVSGEDISSRLSEIFDTPAGAETTSQPILEEEPMPGFLPAAVFPAAGPVSMDEEMEAPGAASPAAPVPGAGTPEAPRPAVPPLTQMHDDEEGFPEEEENAPQSAAGANVATVTLAEIYFQQGLREQALQIYRQLLEREPGNDSVRKRIQEIEASKPETGGPGQGQDPRRPRPGLKVPKRKK